MDDGVLRPEAGPAPRGGSATTEGGKGPPLVTHERAMEAAQRLINSHFGNANGARASIPAHWDDDDLVLMTYLEALQGWEDIFTVPMDGTVVDLWCKRSWEAPRQFERSTDMYWCTTHNCFRKIGHEHYVDHFWNTPPADDPLRRHLIPTHWRPVPLPPSVGPDAPAVRSSRLAAEPVP